MATTEMVDAIFMFLLLTSAKTATSCRIRTNIVSSSQCLQLMVAGLLLPGLLL